MIAPRYLVLMMSVQKQTRTSGGQNVRHHCLTLHSARVQKQTRTSGGQNRMKVTVKNPSGGSEADPNFRGSKRNEGADITCFHVFKSRPELQGVKTHRGTRGRPRSGRSKADPNFRGSKRDRCGAFPAELAGSKADPNFRGSKRVTGSRVSGPGVFKSRPELQGVKTRSLGPGGAVPRCSKADPNFRGSKQRMRGAFIRRAPCSKADPNFRGSKRIKGSCCCQDRNVQKQTRTSGGQNLRHLPARQPPGFKSRPELQGVKTLIGSLGLASNAFKSRPELQGVKTDGRFVD